MVIRSVLSTQLQHTTEEEGTNVLQADEIKLIRVSLCVCTGYQTALTGTLLTTGSSGNGDSQLQTADLRQGP